MLLQIQLKKFTKNFLKTFKKNYKIPLLIFLIAFATRSYKISDYLFFGYEQGRDAQIIQSIYMLRDFVLVGPPASIGGAFHGPWYYYLMALPYGLSGGNPLIAVFFICLLGSSVPLLVFFLAKDFFNSKTWGIFAAVVTIFSYEYILYSRWISNVSPSVPLIILAFLALWKYSKTGKDVFFILSVFFSVFASQFEILLIVQFLFVFIWLFIFRLISFPKFHIVLISLFISLLLFSPLILFDFRNEHITFNSLKEFLARLSGNNSGSNVLNLFQIFFAQSSFVFQRAILNIDNVFIKSLLAILMILGLIFFYFKDKKKAIFLTTWSLMALPIVFISPGNSHYYYAAALGWVLLLAFLVKTFLENKAFRVLAFVIIGMLLLSAISTLEDLHFNKDVFYVTIQDDLNFKDQRAVLNYIHSDAKNAPYRFVSFTIPSLHPEGWQYLHKYYFPNDSSENAKIVYITIESKVYSVWEEKWIAELGESTLTDEKRFGKIRLQKRVLK